jgi:hypothetical protein
MKLAVKEVWIHVNAQPRYGHDAYRILEHGDRNDAKGEAHLLPRILKQNMLQQQTPNEQGQCGVNATALFRNLDIDSGQRKSESVSHDRHSYNTK